jgi:hypothetical protein
MEVPGRRLPAGGLARKRSENLIPRACDGAWSRPINKQCLPAITCTDGAALFSAVTGGPAVRDAHAASTHTVSGLAHKDPQKGAMKSFARCTAALLLWILPYTAGAADDYWAYRYKNVSVAAQGNSAYAVNPARYCVRLDALRARILSVKTKLAGLARAVAAGESPLSVDAPTLRGRAKSDYQRAIAADSGDLGSRHGLAELEAAR